MDSKVRRLRSGAVALGLAALLIPLGAGAALAVPGVTPAHVSVTLLPGASTTVAKSVETPPIPPNPDIVFVADTTSSMGAAIGNVTSGAANIMSTVLGSQPTAEFGVANYTDQNCADAFTLDQAVTANTTAVQNALNALTTPNEGCNTDAAEDFINALFQLATNPAVGFRSGSSRIIVLFGDSSSHDPSNGHSLSATEAALNAANIRVIAVNVPGASGSLFDGLDNAGQATAVATSTGGLFLNSPTVGEISNTILAGLSNLPVTVTHNISCDPTLTVGVTPASQTVTSGATTSWSESIAVSASDPGGATRHCTVTFLLDGQPGGPAFTETIDVIVPGADLAVVKTGPALVTEGQTYSYSLSVTNNGPAAATGVVVSDPLPAATTFVSASAGCTAVAGTVTCNIGNLASGASVSRTITVVAGSAGSSLTNTATVHGDQTDPVPGNNTSTVTTILNHNPVCTAVTAGPDLWPPNHKLVTRTLTGATDPDGDPTTTTVNGVTQDEVLNGLGDGDTSPDAVAGPGGDQVQLRAERSGLGDGRVYRVSFTVTDGRGGMCTGVATVGVPHDRGQGSTAVDSGGVFVDF
jgi:uncharacterized repeat protein (TIGR01451 family)